MKSNTRFHALLLSFCLYLACSPLSSFAETEGPYRYSVQNDGSAVITYFSASSYSGPLSVPSTLGGHTVVAIGGFGNCYDITSVVVPPGVRTINDSAFVSCRAMKTITIPSSVTQLGADVFYNTGLTDHYCPVKFEPITRSAL